MKVKRKPRGFAAICQCGEVVGALDYERTDRKKAGHIIGKWLHDGCTVQPQFGKLWTIEVSFCKCSDRPALDK